MRRIPWDYGRRQPPPPHFGQTSWRGNRLSPNSRHCSVQRLVLLPDKLHERCTFVVYLLGYGMKVPAKPLHEHRVLPTWPDIKKSISRKDVLFSGFKLIQKPWGSALLFVWQETGQLHFFGNCQLDLAWQHFCPGKLIVCKPMPSFADSEEFC